jgi:phosphoglycolate phosphatase
LYDGCEELILELRKQGRRMAILSAAKEDQIHDLLKFHGIDDCFDLVYGLDHTHAHSKVVRGKELAEVWGAYPAENLLLIGDTDHDFEVAEAMNIDSLLLGDGHQDALRLQKLSERVITNRFSVGGQ